MRPSESFFAALRTFENALLSGREVARLRAEHTTVDAEFEKAERRASAELQAIRMRNQIDSSERVLAHFSIEVPRFTR